MASFFCCFLPEASLDCQFHVFLTDSHQLLLNHLLPPAQGCWQSLFTVLGVLGAPQNPGEFCSPGEQNLCRAHRVSAWDAVSTTSQGKNWTQAFSARKYIPREVAVSFQEIMSLLPHSCEENQWKKSQVFKATICIFIFKLFSTKKKGCFFFFQGILNTT